MISLTPHDVISILTSNLGTMPGRRLRVLARLAKRDAVDMKLVLEETPQAAVTLPGAGGLTYEQLLVAISEPGTDIYESCQSFVRTLPLRTRDVATTQLMCSEIPPGGSRNPTNPSLPVALQDLANAITDDIVTACGALNNPDMWYPGVDEGIAPVTDEHVKLVIWAINRELYREAGRFGRPAPTLSELPWRIQRAIVERRRLRYAQWGIGPEQYASGMWSLWAVPEDTGWVPPKLYADS